MPESGWQGHNMGATIYSFNLNISPTVSYGMLQCDIIMLQNYNAYDFVIKDCKKIGVLFVPDPGH